MAKDVAEIIAGRKHAEAIAELFELEGCSESFLIGFYRELHSRIPDSVKGKQELPVMSESDAAEFERSKAKFGKYQGTPYGEIPIGYLTLVADGALKIQAYLRSDRGKRRVEES